MNYQTCIVIGSQWGDEGKGKITNYLSEKADMVIRFQGGNNAGHTIVFDGKKFGLKLLPSGIFNEKIKNVLANGMVINPEALLNELNAIKDAGFHHPQLFISDRAQVIFDYHLQMDELNEKQLGADKIGTTKKGIGPAYTDKVSRQGIRMGDFVSDHFDEMYRKHLQMKNAQIVSLGGTPYDIEESLAKYEAIAKVIKPFVCDTVSLINDAIDEGKKVLFEGAQGSLLDVDFGSYPYVTSSSTSAGGATIGSGVGPTKIKEIVGIVKAYTTRVGEGPFPTELINETGDYIRNKAHEFGVVTHRPRRIGWLDLVLLKYSMRVNGITGISLMLLDILSGFDTIKVCVNYTCEGKTLTTIPSTLDEYKKCVPNYIELPGWKEDITHCTKYEELPKACQEYIAMIEKYLQIPVNYVSVGADRTQTIIRKEMF
jgi:adenylosuccinate synthase